MASGELRWADLVLGPNADTLWSVAMDTTRVFVVGYHGGRADFEGEPLPTRGALVAAFERNGTRDWATGVAGTTGDQFDAVAVSSGHLFALGELHSPAGIETAALLLSEVGGVDITQPQSPLGDVAGDFEDAASHPDGGVVAIGSFDGNALGVSSQGGEDTFLAGISHEGVASLIAHIRGPANVEGEAVAVDNAGNLYATGEYTGEVTLATGCSFGSLNSGVHGFIASYKSNGELRWAVRLAPAGDGEYIEPRDIAVRGDGSLVSAVGGFRAPGLEVEVKCPSGETRLMGSTAAGALQNRGYLLQLTP